MENFGGGHRRLPAGPAVPVLNARNTRYVGRSVLEESDKSRLGRVRVCTSMKIDNKPDQTMIAEVGPGSFRLVFHLLSIVILVACLGLIILAGCSLAETICVVPSEQTLVQGNITSYEIVLDNAPEGLAGYNFLVDLTDQDLATIVAVSHPGWATLYSNTTVPAGSVEISGVDLACNIQNRSANVVLATIQVRGLMPGSTEVKVAWAAVDTDGGKRLTPEVKPGQLTIRDVSEISSTESAGIATQNVTTENIVMTNWVTLLVISGIFALLAGTVYFVWIKK